MLSAETPGSTTPLSGRSILLCQPFLYRLAGSEIVALELADVFSKAGADVAVGTWGYSESLMAEASKISGVEILDVQSQDFEEYLSSKDVDLVWCHQGLVPPALLKQPKLTKFVFSHLSSFAPFERPFAPDVEAILADAVYFVSEEARDELVALGIFDAVDQTKQVIFGNPAPIGFHASQVAPTGGFDHAISSLLVVSNHLPKQEKDAIGLLRERGVDVKVVGALQDDIDSWPERVTPELISRFDAVMTIGKSVQYTLCMGKPVYCYDYFGGPGWIGSGNLSRALYFNFSGRGFSSKPAQIIVNEIVEGYSHAAAFAIGNVQWAQEEFGYGKVIARVKALMSEPTANKGPIRGDVIEGFLSAHATVSEFGNAYYQLLDQTQEGIKLTADHIRNLEELVSALQGEIKVAEKESARASEQSSLTANHAANLQALIESMRQTLAHKDEELRVAKLREGLTQQHVKNLEARLRDPT